MHAYQAYLWTDTAQVALLWPGQAALTKRRERTVHVALQRLRCNSAAMAAIAPVPATSPLDNPRFRGQWEMFNSYDAALQRDKMVPFVDEAKSTTFRFRFTPAFAAEFDVPIYIECNKQRFIAPSAHFAALFSGGFSEGSASSVDSVVDVEGDPEAYADLKRYVHGAVFPIEAANLIHLFALADMYQVQDCCRSIHCRLLALCEHDSCHALATASNIPSKSEGGLREIRDMALLRVAFAGAEALDSDAWLDVPADAARSVLLQKLNATEVQVLDAVLRWVRHRDSTVDSYAANFPVVGSKRKRLSNDAGADTATAAGHSSPAGQSVDNEGRDAALAMLSCVSMAGIPFQRINELVDLDWVDKNAAFAILQAHFSPAPHSWTFYSPAAAPSGSGFDRRAPALDTSWTGNFRITAVMSRSMMWVLSASTLQPCGVLHFLTALNSMLFLHFWQPTTGMRMQLFAKLPTMMHTFARRPRCYSRPATSATVSSV